jgi:hypothetical protein
MTAHQDVLNAKSPRLALLALAEHIDRLELELRAVQLAPGLDDWAGWMQGEPMPEHDARMEDALVGVARAAEVERGAVSAPRPKLVVSDDDAKAWIEKNYGRPVQDDAEGRAVVAQVKHDLENAPDVEDVADFFRTGPDDVVESRIDWSPKSPAHHDLRYDFAKRVLQLDVALGPHPEGGDWAEDYAKAGPMWMYIPNRDLVIQYDENARASMIADLELYDKRVAYEFAYDVLKKPMSTDRTGGAPQPVGLSEHQLD